jgi:hypothetical protein
MSLFRLKRGNQVNIHQQSAIPAVIYKLIQRCGKLYNHECRAQHVNIGHIIFIENPPYATGLVFLYLVPE